LTVCLDSWAVLRWLEGVDPAAGRVEEVLGERPVMSWINVGEVFSITARAVGSEAAQTVVGDLRHLLTLDEVTPSRVLEAAEVKAAHPVAFADAFAVATSRAHGAVLLTGDAEIIEAGGDWEVEDLR
jgi:predicted nucleic acid-binding protein